MSTSGFMVLPDDKNACIAFLCVVVYKKLTERDSMDMPSNALKGGFLFRVLGIAKRKLSAMRI